MSDFFNPAPWPVGWIDNPFYTYEVLARTDLDVILDGGVLDDGTNLTRCTWPGGGRYLRLRPPNYEPEAGQSGDKPRAEVKAQVDTIWSDVLASVAQAIGDRNARIELADEQ